jgi:hypothetical protein
MKFLLFLIIYLIISVVYLVIYLRDQQVKAYNITNDAIMGYGIIGLAWPIWLFSVIFYGIGYLALKIRKLFI